MGAIFWDMFVLVSKKLREIRTFLFQSSKYHQNPSIALVNFDVSEVFEPPTGDEIC